jgi:hypothetical protein
VLSVGEELNDMKISHLRSYGLSALYIFAAVPDILWVSQSAARA